MITTAEKFRHKEEWSVRKGFYNVIVSRHEESPQFGEGPYRWCIYAYIFPRHPMFISLNNENTSFWDEPISLLPFHGGCTFHRLHYNDDATICSIQIGCDYNHLHDTRYTYMIKPDEFLSDARQIIDRLDKMEDEL